MRTKKGFIFIETIIVICVLTVSLMSLYNNYSKLMTNTKELNTFDTTEYNYKTYFLKKDSYFKEGITENTCSSDTSILPSIEGEKVVKICKLKDLVSKTDNENNPLDTVEKYLEYNDNYEMFDAYTIDYLLNLDLTEKNDDIILVVYKKEDKLNDGEYLTYISSLNY